MHRETVRKASEARSGKRTKNGRNRDGYQGLKGKTKGQAVWFAT